MTDTGVPTADGARTDPPGAGPAGRAGRARFAWRPVLAVAALAGVVHLLVATRYGWHRDEFYYVISGRHPAWGYPDQPPLVPLLARLAAALPGGVLPLRVLAIAAQLGCVVLTAVLAAELGGRRRAQTIAAAAVAASPVFVAGSVLFGTTVTDQLAWAAVFVTVTRAVRRSSVGAWLIAGAVGGLGLENKDTIGVLLLGVAAGFVLYRRPALRTPGPWLAAGLALLIAAPNVLWNARYGWPQLRMGAVLSARTGGPLASLAELPLLLLLLAGPPLVVLWISGVCHLATTAGRPHRWILVTAAVAVVVFTAGGGKVYYPAPALLGLFAAGAVRTENRWPAGREGRRAGEQGRREARKLAVALAACGLCAVVIGLPVLPVRAQDALRPVDPEPVETYGWPAFARQVSAAAAGLPSGATVFTSNYGEAGALTMFGPAAGLRIPVSSAHNAYMLWGPPPGTTPDTVLCVGEFDAQYLHRAWSDVREIAPIRMPGGVTNEETAEHAAIYLCRHPRGPWPTIWPRLRHLG